MRILSTIFASTSEPTLAGTFRVILSHVFDFQTMEVQQLNLQHLLSLD